MKTLSTLLGTKLINVFKLNIIFTAGDGHLHEAEKYFFYVFSHGEEKLDQKSKFYNNY